MVIRLLKFSCIVRTGRKLRVRLSDLQTKKLLLRPIDLSIFCSCTAHFIGFVVLVPFSFHVSLYNCISWVSPAFLCEKQLHHYSTIVLWCQ